MSAAQPDEPHGPAAPAPRSLLGAGRGAGPAPARAVGAARRCVLAGLVLVLTVAGCSGSDADRRPEPSTSTLTAPAPETPPPPPPVAVPDVPVQSATQLPAPAAPPPVSLAIADLGITMPVDAVGVEPDGAMSLPATGDRAGWYEFGPAPGGSRGAVVVAAHVDTRATGIGEFAKLVDIQPGAQITLVDAAGATFTYTVSTTERIAKAEVPLDRVFDRAGDRRLVLVTCGGKFDRETGHYVDNVIVTALPAA